MSIIIEAVVEDPDVFHQAKLVLLALLVYFFSSVVSKTISSLTQLVKQALNSRVLPISLTFKYHAANSILCIDHLPIPPVTGKTYTRAMVCTRLKDPSELCYTSETSVRVCLPHSEPLRPHCGHCSESSAHYGRCCYEDYIRQDST